MKWFKIDYNDVFFNGLTTNQIGILIKYRCHCQQYDVASLSDKQIKDCFTWKERQFLVNYLIEKGELSDNFNTTLEQNKTTKGQKQDKNKTKTEQKQDKNGNFLSNKNNDLAIYNNIYNNINNTEETDKTDKRENSDKSPSKKYAFEGKIIRLTQVDFDKWKKAYPDLNLYAELLQRDDYLATQPPDEQKRWYLSTSAFFIKQNERRKAQNNSNNNEDTFGDYL